MATVYSDVGTIQSSTNPETKAALNPLSISSLIQADTLVTISATAAAADVVRLVKVPAGYRLLPEYVRIYAEDPGTTLTVDIGDDDATTAVDADRYVDGLDISAGGTFVGSTAPGVGLFARYTLQAQSWITLTYATASALTSGAKIRVSLIFAKI